MKGFSPFLDTRGYKNWPYKLDSWKYLSEDLFHQFSHSTGGFISALQPELLSGVLKVSSCSSTLSDLVEVEGK